MSHLGKHVILELYDCPEHLLTCPEKAEQYMAAAAAAMQATIVLSTFHHFNPLGVSGVVVIQESHLTIHTWPEYGYAAIDIFTCGDIQMDKGIDHLTQMFQAKNSEVKLLKRGKFPLAVKG